MKNEGNEKVLNMLKSIGSSPPRFRRALIRALTSHTLIHPSGDNNIRSIQQIRNRDEDLSNNIRSIQQIRNRDEDLSITTSSGSTIQWFLSEMVLCDIQDANKLIQILNNALLNDGTNQSIDMQKKISVWEFRNSLEKNGINATVQQYFRLFQNCKAKLDANQMKLSIGDLVQLFFPLWWEQHIKKAKIIAKHEKEKKDWQVKQLRKSWLEKRDIDGNTPALTASKYDHISILQYFLSVGAGSIDKEVDYNGNSYLHLSAMNGTSTAIKQLLEMKVSGCTLCSTVKKSEVYDFTKPGSGQVFLAYKHIQPKTNLKTKLKDLRDYGKDDMIDVLLYEPAYMRLNKDGMSVWDVATQRAKEEDIVWRKQLAKLPYNQRLKEIDRGCKMPAHLVLDAVRSTMPVLQDPPPSEEFLAAQKISPISEFLISLGHIYGKTSEEMEDIADIIEDDINLQKKFHDNRNMLPSELSKSDSFNEMDSEKMGIMFRTAQDLENRIREDGRQRRALNKYNDGDTMNQHKKVTRAMRIAAAGKWVKTWDNVWNRPVYQNYDIGDVAWDLPSGPSLAAGIGSGSTDNLDALIDVLDTMNMLDYKFELSQLGIRVCTDLATISASELANLIATKMDLKPTLALPFMDEAERIRDFDPGVWEEYWDDHSQSYYFQHSKTNEIRWEMGGFDNSDDRVIVAENRNLQNRHEKRMSRRLIQSNMKLLRSSTIIQNHIRGFFVRKMVKELRKNRSEKVYYFEMRWKHLTKGANVTVNYNGDDEWFCGVIDTIKEPEDVKDTNDTLKTLNMLKYLNDLKFNISYDDGDSQVDVPLKWIIPFQSSDKVRVNFKGKGKWYTAKIESIAFENWSSYNIIFLDDEIEQNVPLSRMRKEEWGSPDFDQYRKGNNNGKGFWMSEKDFDTAKQDQLEKLKKEIFEKERAKRLAEELRIKNAAKIEKKKGKIKSKKNQIKKKRVLFEDQSKMKLEKEQNRKIKLMKVGLSVLANYAGEGEWFTGEIIAINDNGTYHIGYDDGDDEYDVILENIRIDPNYVDSANEIEEVNTSEGQMKSYSQLLKEELSRLRKELKRPLRKKDKLKAKYTVWKLTLRAGVIVDVNFCDQGNWLRGEILDENEHTPNTYDVVLNNEDEEHAVPLNRLRMPGMKKKIRPKQKEKVAQKKAKLSLRSRARLLLKKNTLITDKTLVKKSIVIKKKKRKKLVKLTQNKLLPRNIPETKEKQRESSAPMRHPSKRKARRKKRKTVKVQKKKQKTKQKLTVTLPTTNIPQITQSTNMKEAWQREIERRQLMTINKQKQIAETRLKETKRKLNALKAKKQKALVPVQKSKPMRTMPQKNTQQELLLISLGYSKDVVREALKYVGNDVEEAALYLRESYPDPPLLCHYFNRKANFVNSAASRRWRYEQQHTWAMEGNDELLVLIGSIGSAQVEEMPLVVSEGTTTRSSSMRYAGKVTGNAAILREKQRRMIENSASREYMERMKKRLREDFWKRHEKNQIGLDCKKSSDTRQRLFRYRRLFPKLFAKFEPVFGTPVLLWTLSAVHSGRIGVINNDTNQSLNHEWNETKQSVQRIKFAPSEEAIEKSLDEYRRILQKHGIIDEYQNWCKKKDAVIQRLIRRQNKLESQSEKRRHQAEKYLRDNISLNDRVILVEVFSDYFDKYSHALGTAVVMKCIIESGCQNKRIKTELDSLLLKLHPAPPPPQFSKLMKRRRIIPALARKRSGLNANFYYGIGECRERSNIPNPPNRFE